MQITEKQSGALHLRKSALFFVLMILLIVTFFFLSKQIFSSQIYAKLLRVYGPLGIMLIELFGNATVLMPLPSDAILFAFSSFDFGFGFFNPLIIGIFAGIGSAIGELSGYLTGLLGRKSFENLSYGEIFRVRKLQKTISKHGMAFIAFAAFTPIPFDLVGIAAGITKYDATKFFLACLLGKIARCVLIAYAGAYSINLLAKLFLIHG